MTKKKKSAWKTIAAIILSVQFIVAVITIGIMLKVDILPIAYIILIGLFLLWMVTIVYYFFYSGIKKKAKKQSREKKRKKLYAKRTVGCLVSGVCMVICMMGSSMLLQAGDALHNIADQDIMTNTVCVYVLADNSAQNIQDIKDGAFAVTSDYDFENTQKTITEINEKTGTTILTKEYNFVFDMVDALYARGVDAMILNTAYADIIQGQEGYEDFAQKTKILYEHELTTVVNEKPKNTGKDITKDPFVVYISGSDTRNHKLATSRSDVNILAVVNPSTKQVLLLNTPRDYYVETSVSNGKKDKLTHCGIYGIDCSMKTLEMLYDEPVDYYVQINFSGFETLIDAIGGVTVESEQSFRTVDRGYRIRKGTNELNGAQALAYVRERKALASGDNARGRHQMQVIEAIIKKASSGTTILNNYSSILNSMEGMFATDMSSNDIAALVKMQLSDQASWNVKSFAVSGKGSSQKTYSMPSQRSYVMIPDTSEVSYAALLVNKTVDGVILTDADMEMPDAANQ